MGGIKQQIQTSFAQFILTQMKRILRFAQDDSKQAQDDSERAQVGSYSLPYQP